MSRRQHRVLQDCMQVDEDFIVTASFVCNLGVYFKSDISMKTHVSKTV